MWTVWCTYHPAAVLRAGDYRMVYARALSQDLSRVWSRPLAPPHESVWPAEGPVLAIDTEYDGSTLLAVAVARGSRAAAAVVADLPTTPIPSLLRQAQRLVGHNVLEDVDRLLAAGLVPPDDRWVDGTGVLDTVLCARLADENLPSYELEDVLSWLTPVESWKRATRGRAVTGWSQEEMLVRCRADAWATWEVARRLASKVSEKLLVWTQRIAAVLHRVELTGLVISRARWDAVRGAWEARRRDAEEALGRVADQFGLPPLRSTNHHDLRAALDRLGATVEVRTPMGWAAVDREALRRIRERTPRVTPLLDAWSTVAEITKRQSMLQGISELLIPLEGQNGLEILYPRYGIAAARTGRRTSKPNTQNWPKDLRRVVVSRWPGGKILEADFSRLEPVLIAWLAQDEELLEYYLNGDGYLGVGRALGFPELKAGTPLYRAVKGTVLGIHYDMSPETLAEHLWWHLDARLGETWDEHVEAARRLHRAYLRRFRRLALWIERQKAHQQRYGWVTSAVGRVRRLGKGREKRRGNQAVNHPVQSLASDVTGAAVIAIEAEVLRRAGWSVVEYHRALWAAKEAVVSGRTPVWPEVPMVVNEVHDSVVIDVPPGWLGVIEELVQSACRDVEPLRSTWGLDLPSFRVSIQVSAAWGEPEGGADVDVSETGVGALARA